MSDFAADPRDGGLQAERTVPAWTRTSLGVLANGVVPWLKSMHDHRGAIQSIAGGMGVTVALTACLIFILCERTLSRRPVPERVMARRQVCLVGTWVLVLIVVVARGWLLQREAVPSTFSYRPPMSAFLDAGQGSHITSEREESACRS